jgi:ABC-type polysaccharide/polyol phosphate transport system ATPase subunit
MFDLEFAAVSKKYRIRQAGEANRLSLTLKSLFRRPRAQDFWALRDVSFGVTPGEALGVIGHNGAGKSTVLKLLSSITLPTSGKISIRGRLSSLIEIGSGFHPELTGRENIFLNGSLLGMRRREIEQKLDSIVDFAGVTQFIDTPVKRYSSGMYVRLGFSIAAHLDSDILLLDEVLSVGDSAFQSKCFTRINQLREAGKTIVFVSHDLTAVEFVCDRALLLEHGRLLEAGSPRDIIVNYQQRCPTFQSSIDHADQSRNPIEIVGVTCGDRSGNELIACYSGDAVFVRVEYESRDLIHDAVFEVLFYSADNRFFGKYTTAINQREININPGRGFVEFECEELQLEAGIYFLDATVSVRDGRELAWRYRSATLHVEASQSARGSFCLPCEWRIVQSNRATSQPANRPTTKDEAVAFHYPVKET